MDEMMNPNYGYEKLGWKMISFDEPNMSYEYNTLCFWITPDNRVFSASDSGCSCPIPFEEYSGRTAVEIEQKLERVGSYEQAISIFVDWNKNYNGKPYMLTEEFYKETALKDAFKK